MSPERFNEWVAALNVVIWHPWVLYAVLSTGIVFALWSRFCQIQALTHGTRVLRGDFDDARDPGAISHFQALSAALSATVGLGYIAGVAVAIGLGGTGAVFYMWVVGLLGMALKTTEVNLSMMYRNTDDPGNPHGGPMFVARSGFARLGMARLGAAVGGIFVVTLLVSAITGGNMFQSWNVAEVTHDALGIPRPVVGVVLAALVGSVIIGGVQRIGAVAGRLVPPMVALYLIAALYVLAVNIADVPAILALIFKHAVTPAESAGAFAGATTGSRSAGECSGRCSPRRRARALRPLPTPPPGPASRRAKRSSPASSRPDRPEQAGPQQPQQDDGLFARGSCLRPSGRREPALQAASPWSRTGRSMR